MLKKSNLIQINVFKMKIGNFLCDSKEAVSGNEM